MMHAIAFILASKSAKKKKITVCSIKFSICLQNINGNNLCEWHFIDITPALDVARHVNYLFGYFYHYWKEPINIMEQDGDENLWLDSFFQHILTYMHTKFCCAPRASFFFFSYYLWRSNLFSNLPNWCETVHKMTCNSDKATFMNSPPHMSNARARIVFFKKLNISCLL